MGLYSYYLELKNRIFFIWIAWMAIIFVCYTFKEVLLFIITKQEFIESERMPYFIFTNVSEVFTVYVVLILFLGNHVLVLHLLYHMLLFIKPALSTFEYSYLVFIFKTSCFLFVLSVFIFNNLLFPFSWNFFLSFKYFEILESLALCFEAKLGEYLSFYIRFYSLCMLYFQTFLILILLFKYFENKLKAYLQFRKFLYFFVVVFSTIVTPPDIYSQFVSSVSLVFNCEILMYCLTFKNVLIRQPVKAN